jgi:OOP family OmpA-OmpF porin
MNTTLRTALLAGSVLTLAACNVIQPEALDRRAIDPTIAQSAPDRGTAFQRSLHQGYSSFGKWEYDQADYRDAKGFNARAQMSADGQQVNPVDPATRDIAPQFMGELVTARANLMQQLGNADTLNRVPGPAGAAQVYYDCWAEQQEEGHQPEHIAYCKNGFSTAMSQLPAPRPVAQAPAQPAAPVAQAAPAARPYLVFFDWDRSTLAGSSSSTLDEIAAALKKSSTQSTLRISGHADKSGKGPYNDALSQRRAEAVMGALALKGVSRTGTTVDSFGESRPLVDTADDVREPQNRRVEVIVR